MDEKYGLEFVTLKLFIQNLRSLKNTRRVLEIKFLYTHAYEIYWKI